MTTTSSGTGGGSGGGDGGCLWAAMVVRERTRGVIRLNRVKIGDYLLGHDGKYRRVKQLRIARRDLWVHTHFNCGEQALATTAHPWTTIDGACVKSSALTLETPIPCATGVTFPDANVLVKRSLTQVSISLEDDAEPSMWSHTFMAGMKSPELSTHNAPVMTG